MIRSVLGALIGIATAVVTVMLMDFLSHSIYPPPAGIEIVDTEAMNVYLASAPVGALAIVLAGYLMATFDGVFVACLIGRAQPLIYALVIGVLMLAATASNLLMLRHPTWFSVSAIVGIVVSAWLASLLVQRIRPAKAGAE